MTESARLSISAPKREVAFRSLAVAPSSASKQAAKIIAITAFSHLESITYFIAVIPQHRLIMVSMLGRSFIIDKRCESAVIGVFKFSLIIIFLIVLNFFLSGCSRKWNPDSQFEEEINNIKIKTKARQNELDDKALRNVINLKSDLFVRIQENDIQDWLLINRTIFPLVAKTFHNSISWEKRKIMFSEVAGYIFGRNSSEHILAQKRDFGIHFVCNSTEITSFEF